MKTIQQYHDAYEGLYDRFENLERLLHDPPLLAHYTSLPVLEKILRDQEIWLSNPLFMNDIQEMNFGLNEGRRMLADMTILRRAVETSDRALKLYNFFEGYFTKFQNESAFDTYVFCLTEHAKDDVDGLLSMWRGYGSQGNGAALVFNPGGVSLIPNSVLTLATVSYASTSKRLLDLRDILDQWAEITSAQELADENLYVAAHAVFSVLKTYALTSKHSGFAEEKEWRLIYIAESDTEGLLKNCLSHHMGVRGVEPKLKLKLAVIPGVTGPDFNLDQILHEIILGPSHASPLALQSISRMLEGAGRPQYKGRLRASTIPFRST